MALAAWWKLDEGTGTTANDSGPNTRNGTITGATWTASQGPGGETVLLFNGGTNRVSIADHASLDVSQMSAFSIGAWIKYSSVTGLQFPSVYMYGLYGCTLGLTETTGTDGRIEHWRNNSTSLTGSTVLSTNTWHLIVVARNATTTTLYLDGASDGSAASVSITDTATGNGIGNDFGSIADGGFGGYIRDVRLYNHELSLAEVQTWFASSVYNQTKFRVYNDNGSGDI